MSTTRRLPVTLTAAGERALRAGHPWIFDGAIQRVKGEGAAGDLAVVFSHTKNRCIGVGLYDPDSPIRIRVLHGGGPARIDADFFTEKVRVARELRSPLLATGTTGYRLIHGENDGLPGLVADVYAHVLVIKLYSAAWFPWLDLVEGPLRAAAGTTSTLLRLARSVSGDYQDGQLHSGPPVSAEVVFEEHGRKFYANPREGHKTGFFLDHRANRKRVGELAEGKDVLDVFSYAGGFSVHALAGGAASVTSLDISGPALEQATRNVRLNFGDDARHRTLKGDAFEVLAQLERSEKVYDLVIVDPPSFAKREREVAGALKAYRRVNELAVRLVAPGGRLVMASCSARVPADDFFRVAAAVVQRSGRSHRLVERTFHDIDHPIGFPEGAYLKTAYYQID